VQDEPQLVIALEEADRTGIRVLGLRMLTYSAGFVSSTMIARGLGPPGRGQYALPLAYLGIVMILSHVGLEHANVYLAAQRVRLGILWWNSTLAAAVFGAAAWAIVGVLYAGTGGGLFGNVPATWLAIVMLQLPFLLDSLYWTGLLQLAGLLRRAIAATTIGTIVHGLICAALFAAGALTPFRALLLLWATNGTAWLILLVLSRQHGLMRGSTNLPVLRRAIAFGVRAYLALILVFLLLRIDQVIVQQVLGYRALGLYSLAVVLAEVVWLITDPFAASLLPHQVRAIEGNDRRLGYATARLSLLVGLVAGAVAWFVAPYAIPMMFGQDYEGAIWPFRLLLPGAVLFAIQRPLAQILLKEGRLTFITVFNIFALVFNVAATYLLLPLAGVAGASVASTLTYAAVAVAYIVATRQAGVVGWGDLRPRGAELTRLRRGMRL
jgi:O-antigen/teichoic acid export membrane protein